MSNIRSEFLLLNLNEESEDDMDKILDFMHKHVRTGKNPLDVSKEI